MPRRILRRLARRSRPKRVSRPSTPIAPAKPVPLPRGVQTENIWQRGDDVSAETARWGRDLAGLTDQPALYQVTVLRRLATHPHEFVVAEAVNPWPPHGIAAYWGAGQAVGYGLTPAYLNYDYPRRQVPVWHPITRWQTEQVPLVLGASPTYQPPFDKVQNDLRYRWYSHIEEFRDTRGPEAKESVADPDWVWEHEGVDGNLYRFELWDFPVVPDLPSY